MAMQCGVWLVAASAYLVSASNDAQRPNFVVVLQDDVGYTDWGCFGGVYAETPVLDKLAAEGLRMTDFYAAMPLCSPTRAALLTGRLPIRNGFYQDAIFGRNAVASEFVDGGLPLNETTVAELLRRSSYRTGTFGKQHYGFQPQYWPDKRGFTESFGSPGCHFVRPDLPKTPGIPIIANGSMVGRTYEGKFAINRTSGESNITVQYTDAALDFIERAANAKDPFFLYLTLDSTHAPAYASKQFLGNSPRGVFGDAMTENDYSLGRVVDLLDSLGIRNNTMIWVTSDNGPATWLAPEYGTKGPLLCGKQATTEGGMRVPALVNWPGRVPRGRVTHGMGAVMDIFSTVLELAGVQPPSDRPYDGVSLWPLLSGQTTQSPRTTMFYYRGNGLFAVRLQNYKAHFWTWSNTNQSTGPDHWPGDNWDICRGDDSPWVATPQMTNRTEMPVIINLTQDVGEREPLPFGSDEYNSVLPDLVRLREQFLAHLAPGKAQLTYCDPAVGPWSPPGCKEVDSCYPTPPNNRTTCVFHH